MTAALSDDCPVLLGPLRVETKFTATDLLVRVFPDEWAIDKFEPRPTAAELAAIDVYWTAIWHAAGNAAAEQAAWQDLTARIPIGRAGWLRQSRVPANPTDRPTSVDPGTTVLVIVSAQPPAAADRQPALTYWTAIWQAHGDRGKSVQADLALFAAVGASRANNIRTNRPSGVDSAVTDRDNDVVVSFLVLPTPDPAGLATQSWTQAAKATLLPDHITVYGYLNGELVLTVPGGTIPASLAVSPDPGTPSLSIDNNGVLSVPDALKWLVDFKAAHDVGMAVTIPLIGPGYNISNGLDRLVVLGTRPEVSPQQTATDLTNLLLDQFRSPAGFTLLPQGTPTNNTEQAPAGQNPKAQAESGQNTAAGIRAAAVDDWGSKHDGQWFAELLGLDPAQLTGVPNADGTDQRDARAAHTALWPVTWGTFFETTLSRDHNGQPVPIVPATAAEQTRDFFLRHVSGRGPVPSVQIGRQPYGILPTTAFSKLNWPDGAAQTPHRRGLKAVLDAIAVDWKQAADTHVVHLADAKADPHQQLLDILALEPTSTEFYVRYAHSVQDLFNRWNLSRQGNLVVESLEELQLAPPLRALLARFGATNPDADLFDRLFVDTQHPLLGPLVDDVPLSETATIRPYTVDQKQNYLQWLVDKGAADFEALRLENGFDGDRPPAAVLYLLLRHAMMLGWAEAARNLAVSANAAFAGELGNADPLFIHVSAAAVPTESRFRRLYLPAPADPVHPMHKYLPTVLRTSPDTARLAEQIDAVNLLSGLPTAKLERVLTEHLDLATYRLDAWRLGLANERLSELRYGPDGTATPKRGIHLGAYGWLENVKPRQTKLTAKTVPSKLGTVFKGDVVQDPDNAGYIHAPSPAHARTAAVLRAGYEANRNDAAPGTFAVNLTSERVRIALSLLDGLRQGQSLGALLGYRFERALHEVHLAADGTRIELDKYIPFLRAAFPLRFGKVTPDDTAPTTPFEHVEARNVVDGLDLVVTVTRTSDTEFPFGQESLRSLPFAPTNLELAAINAEVQNLLHVHDALADLAVAEGTHQALLGNTERASATLDAYAKDGFPPPPAVVDTPRSGKTLTHRFALALTPGLDPDHGAPLLGHNNPRAQAEPAVNDWLPALLPPATQVVAQVTWTDPVTGPGHRVVSQADIGLQSIDLLWAVRPVGDASMTDLDDRIAGVVFATDQPRPDVELHINYTTKVPGQVTFFELSPVIAALRTLLTTSRPLRTTDLIPAAGGTVDRSVDNAVTLAKARPAAVLKSLTDFQKTVTTYYNDLTALYPAAGPKTSDILAGIDTLLSRYAKIVTTAGTFGLVRSGWGELTLWRRGVFADVLKVVAETAARMQTSLDAAKTLIKQYDKLPLSTPDNQRFALLQQAERLLTTQPTTPRPSSPVQLRVTIASLQADFTNRVNRLNGEAKTAQRTLSGLLSEVQSQLPLTKYDPTGLDLAPFDQQVIAYGTELLTRALALKTDIDKRVVDATNALKDYDTAVTAPDQVAAATTALKVMLGDDVLAVPEFTPPKAVTDSWHKARGDSGKLIDHLTKDPFFRPFPVDDWLHGVARVREMPRLWEKSVLLGDALLGGGGILGLGAWPEPALTPIQLPYQAGDTWRGMDFKPGAPGISQDTVLFTAHYASDPSGASRCGLVLDEWTEVIPADTETTGIAFQVDRPESEPPQAMLLAVPPVVAGQSWDPADLLAAVLDTFELARLRAVEPGHLDDTPYAQLLPATVLSATRTPITISTDLALANLRWKATHD